MIRFDYMDIIEKTVQDIKNLKIQGAMAVARASLKAIKKWLMVNGQWSMVDLKKEAEKLAEARPTEPLTRNCLSYVLWQVQKGQSPEEAADLILARLMDVENEIVKKGIDLIQPGMKILTHCHSSLVEKVLKSAHQKGTNFFVYVTETRPLFQGRITAKNLTKAGIKTTMITDAATAYTLSRLDETEIDRVFLGCDAIGFDGSSVNKIGSYAIALAAKEAEIPLYIISTFLKFAPETKTGELVKIEEREPSEIWKNPPQELRIIGPAFDIVPADKITGFLSEFGLIKPYKFKTMVKKNYPWLLKPAKARRVRPKAPKFSYLHLGQKPNPENHIVATYKITSKEPLKKAADQVAAESSIGTWTKVTALTEKRFNLLSAKVFKKNEKEKTVKIAYPLGLFEKSNLPQLLSSVAGNIFGVKFVEKIRLLDLEFPEKYVKQFTGPGVGLRGIREYLGVFQRPLLASIIKPKEGLPTEEHIKIAKEVYRAGFDLVKDDENLTSPSFNPFDRRLVLMMKVLKKMKTPKLYAFNITSPTHLLMRRAERAKNAGSKCIMVDIMVIGFDTVQSLRRRFPDFIIHGHRAMHAVFTRDPDHGIAMLVLAKLARLSGIDQLHTGTVVGKMEGEKSEVQKINNFLKSDWYGLKKTLPVASGGLYPALIPDLVGLLGKDVMIAFGGGVHGHPQGVCAGAKAVVEAVEAVEKRVSLEKYAQTHQNLKRALKMWPSGKWEN
jgi:ribulose-bisphosphate carboxylase large chain